MLSNSFNYQALFEIEFGSYLIKQGLSEKTQKNYRMDVRNFFEWLHLQPQTHAIPDVPTQKDVLRLITAETLESYKHTLIDQQIPFATINRRLSSLRLFFQFTAISGWGTENPIETIRNVSFEKKKSLSLLDAFKNFLEKDSTSPKTTQIYGTDVDAFLTYLKSKNPKEENEKKLLQETTEETLETYKTSLLEAKTPISTLNRILSSLRLFFKYAQKESWIATDPMLLIENIKSQKNEEIALNEALIAYTIQKKEQGKDDADIASIRAFFQWFKETT